MPSIPIASRASRTSSSLNGLMMAVTNFIVFPGLRRDTALRCARSASVCCPRINSLSCSARAASSGPMTAPLSQQPLLGDRRYQRAVACEDQAPRKTAGTGQARAVLRIEQPFIGAERTMEPHRMIEARGHDVVTENSAAVGDQRGVEQSHIGSIG